MIFEGITNYENEKEDGWNSHLLKERSPGYIAHNGRQMPR